MENYSSHHKIRFLVEAALFAALYAALSYASNLFGMSFGMLQFRLSEVLMPFAAWSPACLIGLSVGCFLADLVSPLGPIDWIFGTLATAVSCLLIYITRKVTIKKLPVLAPLWASLINGLTVGLLLTYTLPSAEFWLAFLESFFAIFISELLLTALGGLPLYALFLRLSDIKGGNP